MSIAIPRAASARSPQPSGGITGACTEMSKRWRERGFWIATSGLHADYETVRMETKIAL
jgi:hypothetical protein